MKFLFFILLFSLFISCDNHKDEKISRVENIILNSNKRKSNFFNKRIDSLFFDINIKPLSESKENNLYDYLKTDSKNLFLVDAVLKNGWSDTIYFLSTSCQPFIHSLCFDTTKFELETRFACCLFLTSKFSISPYSEQVFSFVIHRKLESTKHMQIGFDFYQTYDKFDETKLAASDVVYRPQNKKNIVWSKKQILSD